MISMKYAMALFSILDSNIAKTSTMKAKIGAVCFRITRKCSQKPNFMFLVDQNCEELHAKTGIPENLSGSKK